MKQFSLENSVIGVIYQVVIAKGLENSVIEVIDEVVIA